MRTELLSGVETGPKVASPTTKREDLVTVLAGTWLIIGLFLDGYAHQHLVTETESFVTPWHAVFYSGFAAASAWLAVIVSRRPGRRLRDRVPPGYGATVIGLVAFGVGGIGDAVWHTVFGVEVGIDALLSPTHLILMAGMMAIVTAPYRTALSPGASDKRGTALLSLGVAAGLAAFFLNFVWGLGDSGFRRTYDPSSGAGELAVIAGVASALVTTAVLCLVVILALRLGRPRFGAITLLYVLVAGAVHVAFDEELMGVVAALVGGLVVEALFATGYQQARVAIALPVSTLAMWAMYFIGPGLTGDMAWPPEVWTGTIVLSALAAAAFGYVGKLSLEGT